MIFRQRKLVFFARRRDDPLNPMPRCLTLLLLLLVGCARLPAGQLRALSPPAPANVVLIRGFLDWYSIGIDRLADQLRSDGIVVQTFREEQWRDVAAALRQPSRAHRRLALIGFSYGADDAILISRRLADVHQPVDLLITLDPVTPAKIPPNVKRCINFYEPNGFWDLFPWLRGVPVTAEPGANVQNVNIRINPDLNEPLASHATIAGNEKLHALILRLVQAEMRSRG